MDTTANSPTRPRDRLDDAALALLAGVRAATLRVLPAVLAQVLDRADDALFDFVQKSASGIEQQSYFDAMRDLRRHRALIEKQFGDQLGRSFDALEAGKPIVVRCAPKSEAEKTLSLVGTDELDEQLAAEQLAGALERRHSGPLHLLDRRLARLARVEVLGPATNPVGPGHVVNALREALDGVISATPPRLVVYKVYERDVQAALMSLYAEINRQLAHIPAHEEGQAPPQRRRDVPKSPKYPHLYPEAAEQGGASPGYGDSRAAYGSGSGAGYADAEPQDIDELLPTLRALLSEYRSLRRAHEPPAAHAAPMMDVDGALDTLARIQLELPQIVRRVIDDPTASLSVLLKTEVLRQAERMGLIGPHGRLEERGEESLELVGMLFDALLSQRNYQRAVREQMARMVVPYAKASLLDHTMFALKTHPARQLLNTVTEACDGNRGETNAERELLGRVEGTVDRLVSDFNEDMAIFSELDAELRSYFDQQQQRAAVAERRATETQRGKERLDEARAMANVELATLMGGRPASPAIEQFLGHYWTHHLSVVWLKEGADSPRMELARNAGCQVWNAYLDSEQGMSYALDLREHIERVLLSSGVTGPAADETVGTIEWVLHALRLGRREVANRRNLPSLGETLVDEVASAVENVREEVAEEPAKPQLEVVGGTDTLDYDPEDVERIKALAVGSWVEFIGDDGMAQPAKLSWISPISARLLFVNRRGLRLCASSAEELAIQIQQGKLVLRSKDSAFERAMDQVLGRLQESVAK